MRTNVNETARRIRRQMSSSQRTEYVELTTAINDSVTTFVLDEAIPAIQRGTILSIDNELILVRAVTGATVTSCRRGYLDSDPAAHTQFAEVLINPRFTTFDIYDAMVAEILAWGPNLFRVAAVQLAATSGAENVELGAGFVNAYGVIGVRRQWAGSSGTAWPEITDYRVQRAPAGTWSATAGLSIRLPSGNPGGQILATLALPFTAPTLSTQDLVADCGLDESMIDVLEMGVKFRLGWDGETARSSRNVQDEPRRSEETPIGSSTNALQVAQALYRNRKQEEVLKLRSRYPVRFG